VPICLLAFAGLMLSLHVGFLAGPMWDRDERPHAAYAISLLLGDLPTIDTPVLDDPARFPAISAALVGQDEAHSHIWTANHPPLYYLVSLPFVALADALGMPGAGLLAMRAINAISTAFGLLLVGLIARELVPRRPVIWVLSTLVALSCLTVAHLGGLIFNDGLGVAASSLTILLGIRMLRHGVTPARLAAAASAGAVAASVRAPGVLAVIFCCAAVLLCALHDTRRGRWRRALIGATVVGIVPALSIGWFYLRNIALYGDFGATTALLSKFNRERVGSLVDVMTEPRFYKGQFESLWIRPSLVGTYVHPTLTNIATWIAAGTAIGLTITAIAWAFRTRLARSTVGREKLFSRPTTQAWILLSGFAVAIEMSAISFRAAGGSPHVRYLFPILPPLAITIAVGLMGLLAWVPARFAIARDSLGLAGFGLSLFLFGAVIQTASSAHIASRGGPASLGGGFPEIALTFAYVCAVAAMAMALWQLIGRHWITLSQTKRVTCVDHQPSDEHSVNPVG
jgi:hypothetical protein